MSFFFILPIFLVTATAMASVGNSNIQHSTTVSCAEETNVELGETIGESIKKIFEHKTPSKTLSCTTSAIKNCCYAADFNPNNIKPDCFPLGSKTFRHTCTFILLLIFHLLVAWLVVGVHLFQTTVQSTRTVRTRVFKCRYNTTYVLLRWTLQELKILKISGIRDTQIIVLNKWNS